MGERERGQATVELVGALPALLLAALIALQLLATGHALTLADGAAEAGALALVTGRPVEEAARDAVPGWAEESVEVEVRGGRVTVSLRPPSPLRAVAERLVVTSSASARPKGLSQNPRARLAAPDTLRGAASSVGQMALPFGLPASYPRSVRHSPVAHAGFETGPK